MKKTTSIQKSAINEHNMNCREIEILRKKNLDLPINHKKVESSLFKRNSLVGKEKASYLLGGQLNKAIDEISKG